MTATAKTQNRGIGATRKGADDPLIGRVVGGYRVEAPLGSGASARVYRATGVVAGEAVALKVLRPELSASAGRVRAFLREAEIARRVESSRFVALLDSGREDDVVYIAFELLEGGSVQDLFRTDARLSVSFVARLVVDVAAALSCADRARVVHRDIKPANLLIADDGGLRVVDLGSACDLEVDDARGRAGTARYMAPEQESGFPVDCRADLYSLGVVLSEALSRMMSDGSQLAKRLRSLCDALTARRLDQRLSHPREVLPWLAQGELRAVA